MSKPIVEDISISDEDKEKLNQIINDKKSTKKVIENTKRHAYGGLCSVCAQVPSKNVIYKMQQIEVIERYCSSCYEKNKSRINNDRFQDFAKERQG